MCSKCSPVVTRLACFQPVMHDGDSSSSSSSNRETQSRQLHARAVLLTSTACDYLAIKKACLVKNRVHVPQVVAWGQ
jgi:hypothetical protein